MSYRPGAAGAVRRGGQEALVKHSSRSERQKIQGNDKKGDGQGGCRIVDHLDMSWTGGPGGADQLSYNAK